MIVYCNVKVLYNKILNPDYIQLHVNYDYSKSLQQNLKVFENYIGSYIENCVAMFQKPVGILKEKPSDTSFYISIEVSEIIGEKIN